MEQGEAFVQHCHRAIAATHDNDDLVLDLSVKAAADSYGLRKRAKAGLASLRNSSSSRQPPAKSGAPMLPRAVQLPLAAVFITDLHLLLTNADVATAPEQLPGAVNVAVSCVCDRCVLSSLTACA